MACEGSTCKKDFPITSLILVIGGEIIMAFTIDKFRGKALDKAGARANLFDVTMTGAAAAGLNAY